MVGSERVKSRQRPMEDPKEKAVTKSLGRKDRGSEKDKFNLKQTDFLIFTSNLRIAHFFKITIY